MSGAGGRRAGLGAPRGGRDAAAREQLEAYVTLACPAAGRQGGCPCGAVLSHATGIRWVAREGLGMARDPRAHPSLAGWPPGTTLHLAAAGLHVAAAPRVHPASPGGGLGPRNGPWKRLQASLGPAGPRPLRSSPARFFFFLFVFSFFLFFYYPARFFNKCALIVERGGRGVGWGWALVTEGAGNLWRSLNANGVGQGLFGGRS